MKNLLGIAAMVGAGASMMCSDVLARVALADIPLSEVVMGRGFVGCLVLTVAGLVQGQLRWHPGILSLPVITRILAEVFAGACFISALARMPVANATAILQFIPLVTTLAAAVLFAEKVGWRRWLAGIVGLVGVMLILKPGTDGFNWWSLLAVAAMSCMATRDLVTSRIDKSIPTFLIGAFSAAGASLSGVAMMPFMPPVPPTLSAVGFVTGAGILQASGFLCLIVAARNAEMSAIAPFRYFTLLWAILIGYFAWGQVPDPIAWLGIAIVVAAGLYAFSRERKLARLARQAAA